MTPTVRKWAASLILLLLAGCSASLPPIDPAALPTPPAAFKEGDGRWTVAPPAEAEPRGEWWKAFRDPVLDDLVEESVRIVSTQASWFGRNRQATPTRNCAWVGNGLISMSRISGTSNETL